MKNLIETAMNTICNMKPVSHYNAIYFNNGSATLDIWLRVRGYPIKIYLAPLPTDITPLEDALFLAALIRTILNECEKVAV